VGKSLRNKNVTPKSGCAHAFVPRREKRTKQRIVIPMKLYISMVEIEKLGL
jgi:hypothetical protein